jgi:hypothetical protein
MPSIRIVLTSALVLCIAGASACTSETADSAALPFKTPFTVFQLMEGPIAHAAEVYWDSVSTVVDANGITEHFPKTDEEWEAVWAAGMTLAESGNLLMIAPRAKDQQDWKKWASALIDEGVGATKAAESKDPEAVLAAGERVYNVCTGCHMQYIPQE